MNKNHTMEERKDALAAELKTEQEQRERHMAKLIYEAASGMDAAFSLRMAREAETAEERCFFARIHDMNLQRVQRKVIERNLF